MGASLARGEPAALTQTGDASDAFETRRAFFDGHRDRAGSLRVMAGKVIVLGGGVAGLSAAHELVERGFTVEVFERGTIPGGKARSIPVPGTGVGGRPDLPASTASASSPASTGTSPTR